MIVPNCRLIHSFDPTTAFLFFPINIIKKIIGGDLILASQGTTTIDDKLIALKSITLKDVITFGNIFMKFCQLDSLVHGNVSAQHTYDIINMVWKKTRQQDGQQQQQKQPEEASAVVVATPIIRAPLEKRVIQLNNSNSSSSSSSPLSYLYRFAEFNEANTNSCVAIILQMGILDMKSNAMLAFINHLIREPAFNQLRTEEQLGYIVHTSVKTSGDHIKGLLVLIQSDSFNPNHVEERIELFLMNYRQKLVDMSESDFQTHVDAMVASFLEKVRRSSSFRVRFRSVKISLSLSSFWGGRATTNHLLFYLLLFTHTFTTNFPLLTHFTSLYTEQKSW